jgi:hypothetical protein
MSIPDVSDRTLVDLMSLDGRVAVVTGGAVGIGGRVMGTHLDVGDPASIVDCANLAVVRPASRGAALRRCRRRSPDAARRDRCDG